MNIINPQTDKIKAAHILDMCMQNNMIDKVDYDELLELLDERESAFNARLTELNIKNIFYKEFNK